MKRASTAITTPAKRPRTKTSAKTKAVRKYTVPRIRSIVNMGIGFPMRAQMVHKYVENVVLSSSSGGPAIYNWSCNGMYDPNITGTGHQPLYFDQMGTFYRHYTVIRSKLKATFIPGDTVAFPFFVSCYLNDDTGSTPSVPLEFAEQTLCTWKPCAVNNNPLTITKYWDARKTFGGDPLSDANLTGTTSVNPTEQTFFTVCVQSANQTTTQDIIVVFEAEYTAVWEELVDTAQS